METFFSGFQVKPPIRMRSLPVAPTLVADPMLIPPDARVLPYSDKREKVPDRRTRVATPKEHDRLPHILSKPEAQYTEAARSHQIVGTVMLRMLFTKEGSVENITVIRGLPHGLTQAAITAAQQLKFKPATKDGQAVSMYAQVDYNFNLY